MAMPDEQAKIEAVTSPEIQGQLEVQPRIESPEEVREQMLGESEKETETFKSEGAERLAQAEARAEQEGTIIDPKDKEALLQLDQEADVAKSALAAEIGNEEVLQDESPLDEEIATKENGQEKMSAQEILRAGQEKIHAMFAAGKQEDRAYISLGSMLMRKENGGNVWKSAEEIDANAVEGILKEVDQEETFEKGKGRILKLYAEGKDKSPEYLSLYQSLTKTVDGKIKWKGAGEIDAAAVKKDLDAMEAPVQGGQPETESADTAAREEAREVDDTSVSAMKERVVEDPKLLSEREASKQFFAEERKKLAEEIRAQRKSQRDRLTTLNADVEHVGNAPENMDAQQEDEQYGNIMEARSNEANALTERLTSAIDATEQDIRDEKENVRELIASSKGMELIKAKLQEHYLKADAAAKSKFESMRKTVEQTLIRNNAFIVHTFLLNEELRHNENSNISSRAELKDDIDILLSLEPSISTSSVVPGSRQGLWGGRLGVVLGGGDIRGVMQSDEGTVTGGIKFRNGKMSSSQEIDEKVSDKGDRGYNELVVNNPKVFGFFQNVSVDKSGKMMAFSPDRSDKRNKEKKDDFMKYMSLAKEKGMPPLIMTPDRKLFEFLSVGEDGTVMVGSEITPEQVAKGKAGLPDEKRQEIGEEVVSKNLFKHVEDQKEAKGIVAGLSGKEGEKVELSREEYLAYAKDNQGSFHELPKNLLGDKEFMMEAAQFDPVSAYQYAGENLQRDIDFIKHIFSLEKKGITGSVYVKMPDDLRKNESIALLAIENNDFEDLDASLADSPVIYEKLVDKMVDKINPNKFFERKVGEDQSFEPYLSMRSDKGLIDLSERLLSDKNFVQKLHDRYPNFKFNADVQYKRFLVTKLS